MVMNQTNQLQMKLQSSQAKKLLVKQGILQDHTVVLPLGLKENPVIKKMCQLLREKEAKLFN